jgi:hypothetical protein
MSTPIPSFSGGEVIGMLGQAIRLLAGPFVKISIIDPSCAEFIVVNYENGGAHSGFRLRLVLTATGFLNAPIEVKVVRVFRDGRLIDNDPSILNWTHQQGTQFDTKTLNPGPVGRLLVDVCGSDDFLKTFDIPSQKNVTGGHRWKEPGRYRIDSWVHVGAWAKSKYVSVNVFFDPEKYSEMRFTNIVITRTLSGLDKSQDHLIAELALGQASQPFGIPDHISVRDQLGVFLHQGEVVERLIISEMGSDKAEREQTAWMIAVWNFLKKHLGMAEAGQFKAIHQANIRIPPNFPEDKISLLEQMRGRKEFLHSLIDRLGR